MTLVLVMILAALFSVLTVAVLVGQRRPGRDRRWAVSNGRPYREHLASPPYVRELGGDLQGAWRS